MKINETDGGPAFTFSVPQYFVAAHEGMSLRDYFAARAMEALMQMDGIQFAYKYKEHAAEAYKQADAMIKAREATT